MSNRFATASRKRVVKKGVATKNTTKEGKAVKVVKRRPLDDYETPEDKTAYLGQFWKPTGGSIFECAAGSGRMVRQLKAMYKGVKIYMSDIKTGQDFTTRKKVFAGDIVTNPPYKGYLGDAFIDKALELADGEVAMLMQGGFIWGERRNRRLYSKVRPRLIIIIPERVLFFKGGTNTRIEGQFYSNAWLIFPNRKTRAKGGYKTEVVWPAVVERETAPKKAKAKADDFDFG